MKSGVYVAVAVLLVLTCCLEVPVTTFVVSDVQLGGTQGGVLCYSMQPGDECEEFPGGCGGTNCVGFVNNLRCPNGTKGSEGYDEEYETCELDVDGTQESDAGEVGSHTCYVTRFCRADNCVPDTNDDYWCSPLPPGTGADPVETNVAYKTCKDLPGNACEEGS